MSPVHATQFSAASGDPPGVRLSRPGPDWAVVRPTIGLSERSAVRPVDPAMLVTTDFRQQPPITVRDDRPIDDALRDMSRFGVHALLVARDDAVSGLITSYDIYGERPLQLLQSSTFTRREEIEVWHIMTPWEEVPALEWATLQGAQVGDVLEVLEGIRTSHLVVVETALRFTCVRGLISRARIERQICR